MSTATIPLAPFVPSRRLVPRCLPARPTQPDAPESTLPPEFTLSTDLVRGLSDRAATAIAGLLPAMVCGEESAVMVFGNEYRRVSTQLFNDSTTTLDRIASEEETHETQLRALASFLPEPAFDAEVRQNARRFFLRLKSDDIATHFSRIAWLDSGVCIIFSRLIAAGSPVRDATALHRALRRILRDEATHVAFSRRYAAHLGLNARENQESFHAVRAGLVQLLAPCAPALDALNIDPAELFTALKNRGFVEHTR